MTRWLKPELLLPLLVALPLFFWGTRGPFQDPDEGMHGSIAREMIEGGDWVTPRFDGLRVLEKPPLYHWLTALTYLLFGFSEWGARLWSILGAVGTVLFTAVLGREALGPRTGLAAGLICATTLGIFLQTRNLGIEPLFTAFLSLALASLVRWIRAGGTAPRVVFYLALALATLTKGPLALFLFALVLGAYGLSRRGRSRVRDLGLWWGVPLVLIVVLPWYLAASRANPGFVSYYVGETHLVRFLRGTDAIEDERPLSTAAFLLVSMVWFLPWSFFLPSAALVGIRRWQSLPSAERATWTVLGLWTAVIFGFFALSSFKLEYYALPAFPALAVLVGGLWSHERPRAAGLGAPLAAGCSATLLGIGIISIVRWLAPNRMVELLASFANYSRTLLEAGYPLPLPPPDVFLGFCVGALICLWLGFTAAAVALRWHADRAAFVGLLMGTTAFLVSVGALIGEITPFQSVKGVATAIRQLAAPEDLILYEGYLEHAGGLPFYTGRQIHLLGAPRGDLAFGSRFPESRGLFHPPDELPRIWQGERRVFLVTDLPPELSQLRTVAPEGHHLLALDHGKRLYSNRPAGRPPR